MWLWVNPGTLWLWDAPPGNRDLVVEHVVLFGFDFDFSFCIQNTNRGAHYKISRAADLHQMWFITWWFRRNFVVTLRSSFFKGSHSKLFTCFIYKAVIYRVSINWFLSFPFNTKLQIYDSRDNYNWLWRFPVYSQIFTTRSALHFQIRFLVDKKHTSLQFTNYSLLFSH